MDVVRIPQRIDEPPNIMLWSLDEVLPIGIGLVLGILLGQAAICTLIGATLTYWYRKYREAHPDGFFIHVLYWYGFPFITRSALMTNPFIRRFIP